MGHHTIIRQCEVFAAAWTASVSHSRGKRFARTTSLQYGYYFRSRPRNPSIALSLQYGLDKSLKTEAEQTLQNPFGSGEGWLGVYMGALCC